MVELCPSLNDRFYGLITMFSFSGTEKENSFLQCCHDSAYCFTGGNSSNSYHSHKRKLMSCTSSVSHGKWAFGYIYVIGRRLRLVDLQNLQCYDELKKVSPKCLRSDLTQNLILSNQKKRNDSIANIMSQYYHYVHCTRYLTIK